MQETSNPFLESKKIADPFIRYKSELVRVFEADSTGGILSKIFGRKSGPSLLTKENAELGLLLINQHPAYKDAESTWTNMPTAAFNGARYKKIMLLLADDWNSDSNFQLLTFFFGAEKAECVRHAWQQMPYQMYQSGSSRRSFRSPANRSMYFQRQIEFFAFLLRQTFSQVYDSGYKYEYYNLTLTEQIRYNHTIGDTNQELFRVWSSAIDLGNKDVLQLLEDIVYNKDDHGKLTRSIIKALLNCNKPEAWIIVEKLLLAAQRQEGLRQTILESLDETSIGALKYMIQVLIDHDLARFSSVVRSIDVWAGLGWESERETTVRSFLEKASYYLEHQDAIPGAIQSENNADVYMALWAQGVYDVEQTLPYLQKLYRTGDVHKRTLALLFATQTAHYLIGMPLCVAALEDRDLQPIAVAVAQIYTMASVGANEAYYSTQYPELFRKLNDTYKRFNVKERTFESFVFSWMKISFDRKTILLAMVALVGGKLARLETLIEYLEDMDGTLKRQLSWKILPQYSRYGPEKLKEQTDPLTPIQRKFALLILRDRSEFEIGFKALRNETFSADELTAFPDWLKRKGAAFRGNIISILLRQKDEKLIPVLEELLKGDPEQRLAGLDILIQLNNQKRRFPQAGEWIEAFRGRKISPKEEVLLAQLITPDLARDVSASNGFGMFDPEKCAPVTRPAIDKNSLYEKLFAKQPYALSMPVSRVREAMWDLNALIEQHRNYEYEVENYMSEREKVLLGNMFRQVNYQRAYSSDGERYKTYPLPEVWAAWYDKWQFEPRDIRLLHLACYGGDKVYRDQLPDKKEFVPEKYLPTIFHFASPVRGVLEALKLLHPMPEADEFFLGASIRLFASFSEEELKAKPKQNYWSSNGDGWQQNAVFRYFTDEIRLDTVDAKLLPKCWELFHWRQFSGREENIRFSAPPLVLFCRAYEVGRINEQDMLRALFYRDNIQTLSAKTRHASDPDFFGRFSFLRPMFDSVRDHILDIELQRGDTPTPLTSMAGHIRSLYGVSRLKQILAGMGKTTLKKGFYYYGTDDSDKQSIFSGLLKKCYPLDSDTQEQFNEIMKEIKATEQRLIETAVYAPQWQRFVSNYLGWTGLDTAIWWMHAHTKTDGYSPQNAEAESEIARHSSLDVQEFKDGAVDKDWFHNAFSQIGSKRWTLVYDAAKYITDGNGHRRARIYADVLQGNLSLKDVTEKIATKRDQDYVRIYGLAPLNKAHPQQDILARYEFIQQFRKDSRQFGAQKQASEAAAVNIAMDNLARNAGYPDPIRLTWAMETRQIQAILSKETKVQCDDVVIALVIDEEGEADVVAYKEDKPLKAVPAKYKRDAKVEELNEFKKTLREQFRRSRKGLEEAMVRGDVFAFSELQNLFAHPVIARHLEKLVFILVNRPGSGFYKDGMLVDSQGEVKQLKEADRIRIAHSIDLHQSNSWAGYQRSAFDQQLQQPFKQIFRELYLPTPDEQQEKSVSRRYAGHQIQPKKTVALLRTRGWKANYEQGLQKVFHKEGFAAQMYALADWFSPADIESPTLETVVFTDLKTLKNVPFSSIHPRIFSEVMRDIDLVVSVAHAGGVDPEASHSTIEMRAALLKETIRLFKLGNVFVESNHALIKGTMGEYSVHLGSAVVHRVLSGYLSILPVQSQHRGRIFLPFVDDDPRSAELLSKVLLLSRDKEIKDPLILQQLR
jgi:hypothetical protein